MKPLPSETVSRISSGQIIVSIYTAVKELIENALDSEASMIQVDLQDYGLEKITVRDNGVGVQDCDIPLMVKNHYTSKIIGFSDLGSLQTYGFRGEALHAIMESSSELEILSRSKDSPMGSLMVFDCKGNILKQVSQAVTMGTTISASQLFHRTPVRRERYKKSPSMKKAELKDIESLILGFSLIYPGKRFLLSSHKSVIFQRPACKTFRDSVIGTLGKSIADKWTNVTFTDDSGIEVDMWLSKNAMDPTVLRSSNDRCFLFVNERPVELPKLSRLLKKYLSDPKKKSYPICLVKITVPLKDLDANVEPSKKSVFFKQEESLLKAIDEKLSELYSSDEVTDVIPVDEVVEARNTREKDNVVRMEMPKEALVRQNFDFPKFVSSERAQDSFKPYSEKDPSSNSSLLNSSTEQNFGCNDFARINSSIPQHKPEVTKQTSLENYKYTPEKEASKSFSDSSLNSSSHEIRRTPAKAKHDSSKENIPKTPAKIVDNPLMSKDPELSGVAPFQNNSFVSSTLLEPSGRNNNSSFVNSSKEDSINSKMSTLYSWATGKTLKDSPPVGMILPRLEGSNKRSYDYNKKQSGPPPKRPHIPGDNSLIRLIKPSDLKETVRIQRSEVHVSFDMESLSSGSPNSASNNELSIVGKLTDSDIWMGVLNSCVFALHPSRFREINTYNRLMEGQILEPVPRPYPLEISDPHRSKRLVALLKDDRLSHNGFKASGDGRYLTHSCHDLIPEIGLEDLNYVLDVIGQNPEATLLECRSPGIQRFFQKECLKLLANCPPGVSDREMYQLYSSSLKYFKNVTQESCFHRKKIMLKLCEI